MFVITIKKPGEEEKILTRDGFIGIDKYLEKKQLREFKSKISSISNEEWARIFVTRWMNEYERGSKPQRYYAQVNRQLRSRIKKELKKQCFLNKVAYSIEEDDGALYIILGE